MYRRVLYQRRLCCLAIATVLVCTIFTHTTNLLRESRCTAESKLTTQFPLTKTGATGTESGVIRVGSKSSMKVANGSLQVHRYNTTPCSPSSLLYWPNNQQWTIQPLFSKREASVFMDKIRSLHVVSLEEGCSTTSTINRLATLEDGTKVCCRILKIGNIYSYHLNWLLGLRNVPPITAVKLNMTSEKWKNVHDGAKAAGWRDGIVIIMELFIDNLTEVYNLPYFSNNETSILTVPVAEKLPLTPVARKMMVQWSDMILFDFLTGHADRKIFSNHKRPVKNLYRTFSSKLVLIDNESTFRQGYQHEMFYKNNYCKTTSLFLRRTCAFRQRTIEGILSLERHSKHNGSPVTVLRNYIKENDPYTYNVIHMYSWQGQVGTIERNMRERIEEIKSRLVECESHVLQCH